MPSRLSSIGLPLDSLTDLQELVGLLGDDLAPSPFDGGAYWSWSSDCGAELWLHVDGEGNVTGYQPHFLGPSRTQVALVARIFRGEENGFEGGFRGWANPTSNEPSSGVFPFLFDCPDFRLHDDITLPARREVQLAGFADEVYAFANEAEFARSQVETQGLRFAPRSFLE